MSTIKRLDSIAANAVVDDQLVASNVRLQLRTAQEDGLVEMALSQSATGLNVDIIIGDQVVASSLQPNIKASAPLLNEDGVGTFPILAGEQVSLAVRNTTAGALNLGYAIDVPG